MRDEDYIALQNSILEDLAKVEEIEQENEAIRQESEQIQSIKRTAMMAKSTAQLRAEQAREAIDPIELVTGLHSLIDEADGSDSEGLAVLQFKANVYGMLLKKVLPDLRALEVKVEDNNPASTLKMVMVRPANSRPDLDGEKVAN